MARDRLILGGAALVGLCFLAVFYFITRPAPEPPVVAPAEGALSDQPGPYLELVIEGRANGIVRIDLNEAAAPLHTARMRALAESGAYDAVVFHRVIEGFMAQTGDVEFGKLDSGDLQRAGRGGSDMPDLPAEFSDIAFERGVVGMARSQSPDSANSQFFIMFAPSEQLNGQYTVVGRVTEGMEVVDAIKRGEGDNGEVIGKPDVMRKVSVAE